MAEKGRALPKFGEWDVSDPSSGTDFSVIFNKARNERKQCAKARSPPNTCNSPQYNPQLALRKSHCKKWFCCISASAEA